MYPTPELTTEELLQLLFDEELDTDEDSHESKPEDTTDNDISSNNYTETVIVDIEDEYPIENNTMYQESLNDQSEKTQDGEPIAEQLNEMNTEAYHPDLPVQIDTVTEPIYNVSYDNRDDLYESESYFNNEHNIVIGSVDNTVHNYNEYHHEYDQDVNDVDITDESAEGSSEVDYISEKLEDLILKVSLTVKRMNRYVLVSVIYLYM